MFIKRLKDYKFIIIAFVLIASGGMVYSLYGHQAVKAAYEGRLPGFLSRIISGQSMNSLDTYYHLADGYVIKLCFILFLIYFLILSLVCLLKSKYSQALISIFLVMLFGSLLHVSMGYSSIDDPSGHTWGCDDAYISYRYSLNLANGNGPVYNPGEKVEGYSNFLYMLMIAFGLLFFDPNNVYVISCILNFSAIILAFLFFYRYCKKHFGKSKAVMAMFLFALCPVLWAWVASGLETIFILLIQILIWITVEELIERKSQAVLLRLSLFMVLLIFFRADGFIVPLIILFYLFLKGDKKAVFYCGSILTAVLSLYFLWRYNYYGYIFSNTYYAKVSGPFLQRIIAGLRLLGKVSAGQGLLIYFIVILIRIRFLFKNINQSKFKHFIKNISFELYFAICLLLYWIWLGGDNFGERFLIIIFPIGIFTLIKFSEHRMKEVLLLFLVVIVGLIQLEPFYGFTDGRFAYSFSRYDRWITLGKFLKTNYPDAVIATGSAGKIPYFSQLENIDMLGLTDEYIGHKKTEFFSAGHNKYDSDYIFSRKPDLIVTWIFPSKLCYPDLEEHDYIQNGYYLKYLANTSKDSRQKNIIDVEGMSQMEIVNLIEFKYDFAVLVRK